MKNLFTLFIAMVLTVSTSFAQTLFTNVNIFDGTSKKLITGKDVLVENNLISKIGSNLKIPDSTTVIDGQGMTLMPGLIDTHTHIAIPEQINALKNDVDWMYWGVSAAAVTTDWLMRGYTTVRDAAGPSMSLHKAVEEGKLIGPRIYSSGAIISQTSGHGDHRFYNTPHPNMPGNMPSFFQTPGAFEVIADGVPEVLRATREVLKTGATQIKIVVGGGASSNFGPLYTLQFLPEEIEAVVRAARDYDAYVMAHAYHDESIIRAIDAGVRSIEHGTLMTKVGMDKIMEADAWISPYFTMLSLPFETIAAYVGPANESKARQIYDGAINQINVIKASGYDKVAFGADVVGPIDVQRTANNEFVVRAKYWPTAEVLKQATHNNGRLLREETGKRNPYQEGELGVINEGAYADIILVDGNPLEKIDLLTDPYNTIQLIMKDGKIYKNTLND
ncbi:MAG: amidohydrolase family protein [Reichenbachiella sp.]